MPVNVVVVCLLIVWLHIVIVALAVKWYSRHLPYVQNASIVSAGCPATRNDLAGSAHSSRGSSPGCGGCIRKPCSTHSLPHVQKLGIASARRPVIGNDLAGYANSTRGSAPVCCGYIYKPWCSDVNLAFAAFTVAHPRVLEFVIYFRRDLQCSCTLRRDGMF